MAKMLKFGGPNLPAGTHTWFQRFDPATSLVHETIQVSPGDIAPAAVVGRATGELYVDSKGDPALPSVAAYVDPTGQNVIRPGYFKVGERGEACPDYYVNSGRASYVDVPEATQKN